MKIPFPSPSNPPEKDLLGDDILVVQDLKKRYEDFYAVDGISFSVRRGSLFAFLGQNGAGKSTTINIICSILGKDSGKIYVDGYDLDRRRSLIKSKIGIVFQNSVLDKELSPKENLSIRAGFYGIRGERWKERMDKLVEMLEIGPFLNRPVGKLSGGQKRRVDIARAMVHDPMVLILDEPTTGLDPQTRISVWNLVNDLRDKTGMTVFLTTHYMEEAEKATDVVIMDKGRIIARGTPTELKNRYSGDYLLLNGPRNEAMEAALAASGLPYRYNEDAQCYRVRVSTAAEIIAFLQEHKGLVKDFEVKKGDMDDVFLNVTGMNKKESDSL